MEFIESLQLPAWLTTFNLDYVIGALVVFSLIRSLFSNYRARLRVFLWFTIPFAILIGLLFVDTTSMPFLQMVVDTTQQAWIGTISSNVAGFFLGLYQTYVQSFVPQLPFGLPTILSDLSLVYLLIMIAIAGVIALVFASIGGLIDRPHAPKHDEDKPKSFTATPLISLIITVLSNAVAVYTFYLVFSLLNISLGLDVTTGQYLFPFLNEFDPILDKLVAVIAAVTSI